MHFVVKICGLRAHIHQRIFQDRSHFQSVLKTIKTIPHPILKTGKNKLFKVWALLQHSSWVHKLKNITEVTFYSNRGFLKETFLFFMCGILLRHLQFFHPQQRINNIPACPSVSKSSFQSRYTMMIDEAVGPTVAGRAAWQEFSVIERNLKYLFHLLY